MKAILNRIPERGWAFWLAWALVFVGFPIGALAGQAVAGPATTAFGGLVGGAVTGLVLGGLQWIVLRRRLEVSAWWVVTTGLGLGIGLGLGLLLFGADNVGGLPQLRALVTGAALGLAQAWLLRRTGRPALLWALVVTAGWVLGWTITAAVGVDLAPAWTVFGSTGAWAFQLLTGLTLAGRMGRAGARVSLAT